METKQVIVVRRDLNMRKGKMAAQAAHASMMFLTRNAEDIVVKRPFHDEDGFPINESGIFIPLSNRHFSWLRNSFTKIVVSVNSEEELYQIVEKARLADVESYICVDSGKTEFNGVPTPTCAAIGPDRCDIVDSITGHLPLM